ncbi:MAG: RluA family pseudouridine synthase [Alphaproteobacteria bacterium]|nr:RluA family pseudouridine synthase [Alphaproteobacteria bacterium]
MGQVQSIAVAAADAEIRLDRWFKRHFPDLSHGKLEQLLRTGQIRLDGKRAAARDRVAAGQIVRVPPLPAANPQPAAARIVEPSARDAKMIQARVLHRDDDVIVIDKPQGLAVQGGTKTDLHLDGLLDALRFGAEERPRLVHRLDKDTSGVLVLARSARAAAKLAEAFRDKAARKIYWAAVVGVPKPELGRIDQRLAKLPGRLGERVVPDDDGKRAVTYYRTVAHAGDRLAWVALEPVTGRTHQLRAHCAALGTPILGDGKYGGAATHVPGVPGNRRVHLHARALTIPHPAGGTLIVMAPLPPHMRETWDFFGFEDGQERDVFADLAPEKARGDR